MITDDEISKRIEIFKTDLQKLDDSRIISKYFYNDFEPAAISLEMYHDLRWEIKEHFTLLPMDRLYGAQQASDRAESVWYEQHHGLCGESRCQFPEYQ